MRWADITQLEKSATLLLPDAIKVSTRVNEHVFSVFLNINETFKLAEQLANIAMRQLLDNKGFEQDRSLPKLKKKSPKKVSALKRSEKKRLGRGTIINNKSTCWLEVGQWRVGLSSRLFVYPLVLDKISVPLKENNEVTESADR